MILRTQQEKIAFIEECYLNIRRIFTSYLTDSEKEDALPNQGRNSPHLDESDEKLIANLPKSIEFGGWLRNIKMGKLNLFVAIYNEASKKIEAGEEINLDTFFPKIKREIDFKIGDRIYTDSDSLMTTHRRHFLRKGLLSFLSYFFSPKSKSFLDKYRFFESKKKLPLVEAVRNLELNKVRSLASASTVNQKDDYGYGSSPLSLAAYRGNQDITQLLIDKGAYVDSEALNSAIQAGNLNIVRLLLANGANINQPDSSGTTPLRQAIHYISYDTFQHEHNWSARIDIINELLKHPFEWDKHTKDGQKIIQYVRSQKERLVSNWPDHPNRAGFELICQNFESGYTKMKTLAEIRKNTRLIAQGHRDKRENGFSFFKLLPRDVCAKIAGLTGDPKIHNSDEAEKIARGHFLKPE